jgi:hypothetical protein
VRSADVERKIAALEARAASTTFSAERESCLRVITRLRAKAGTAAADLEGDEWGQIDQGRAAAMDAVMDAALWAEAALHAHPCPPDWCGRTDMWVVPGHGPALDYRGLVALAIERGALPASEHLQAAMIRTMGWSA